MRKVELNMKEKEKYEKIKEYVDKAFDVVKNILGNNWVHEIGKNMTILDKVIELAYKYEDNELKDS